MAKATPLGDADQRFFEIENTGYAPLVISAANTGLADFSFGGGSDDSSNFSLQDRVPLTLAGSERLQLSVVFRPSAIGTQTATLSFETNISVEPVEELLTTQEGVPDTGYPLGEFRKTGASFELTIPPFAGAENGEQFRLAFTPTLSEETEGSALVGFEEISLSASADTLISLPETAFTAEGSGLHERGFLHLERIALAPAEEE